MLLNLVNMKKISSHLFSIGSIILFISLAGLCDEFEAYFDTNPDPPPPENTPCLEILKDENQLGFVPCQPIDPPIIRHNILTLFIKDQAGNPLNGIKVKFLVNDHLSTDGIFCLDAGCFTKLISTSPYTYNYETDENGKIYFYINNAARYEDRISSQTVSIKVIGTDGTSVKFEVIRFPFDIATQEKTIHLFNDEYL